MEMTRRDLLKKSGKFILLTSAAAAAWEFVLEGKAEAAAQLRRDQALVGDGHRSGKMHRLRQLRARLRSGERRAHRATSALGSSAITSMTADLEHPQVDSPEGGHDGFPEKYHDGGQDLLHPQALQPLRRFALRAGVPGGRDLRHARRRRAGR